MRHLLWNVAYFNVVKYRTKRDIEIRPIEHILYNRYRALNTQNASETKRGTRRVIMQFREIQKTRLFIRLFIKYEMS